MISFVEGSKVVDVLVVKTTNEEILEV